MADPAMALLPPPSCHRHHREAAIYCSCYVIRYHQVVIVVRPTIFTDAEQSSTFRSLAAGRDVLVEDQADGPRLILLKHGGFLARSIFVSSGRTVISFLALTNRLIAF
jgi:hypothetical protein